VFEAEGPVCGGAFVFDELVGGWGVSLVIWSREEEVLGWLTILTTGLRQIDASCAVITWRDEDVELKRSS
jgi:hypothetical protein